MRTYWKIALLSLGFLLQSSVATAKQKEIEIPYEHFTLPNGLNVIVHTDRKAPIVAVNVWYHVGSKDEPVGRSGFAHLFEHLMFQASENHKGEYFAPFKKIGTTGQNGTTNQDRTNYFQNVPTTALDTALFMESDRMGFLLGAVTKAALDEQRGVVQNEKRQRENRPYGSSWSKLFAELYPKGHPYHHSVIGSMNDLNAATLDDVKNWFKSWYGPNNAVLVLAGDIDVKTAKEKTMAYFGNIPASATVPLKKPILTKRPKATRSTLTDKVPQTMILKAWKTPHFGTKEASHLDLVANILGSSGTSRLNKRLLLKDKLVDSISAYNWESELSGNFLVSAMIKKGVDAKKVEKIIQEELNRFIKEGPTKAELAQSKSVIRASFLKSIERVGGFGGKSDVLAKCLTYTKNPACYKEQLKWVADATVTDLKKVAKTWLDRTEHTLSIVPGEKTPVVEEPAKKVAALKIPAADKKWKTVASKIDRSKGVPMPDRFPKFKFPKLEKNELTNGLQVVSVQRKGSPVVDLTFMLKTGGYSTDPANQEGRAQYVMEMLTEGSNGLSRIDFVAQAEKLGADIKTEVGLDNAYISLSVPYENVEKAMSLFAGMVMKPSFAKEEMERLRAQKLAGLKQEKSNPRSMVSRVLPFVMFGKDHHYGKVATGFETTVSKMQVADLKKYHQQYIRPENIIAVGVGPMDGMKMKALVNSHFKNFKGVGKAGPKAMSSKNPSMKPMIYLVDQPGAVQANIVAAKVMPSSMDSQNLVYESISNVLGGDFTARLNMNLREDKHWSYGARSRMTPAMGPSLFTASAPVQIDKTKESVQEIVKEINHLASGKRPVEKSELERIVTSEEVTLPGKFETNSALKWQIISNLRFDRPENYVDMKLKKLKSFTPKGLQKFANQVLTPNELTWVIVGDVKKIRKGIESLKLGKIQIIDADGKKM